MTLTIPSFLGSMLIVGVMISPLIAAAWTWWICRDRKAVDEGLVRSAQNAWEQSGKTSERMIGTSASMVGVMERIIKNQDKLNDRLAEVALTTHEGAAVERMHNTAQRMIQAQRYGVGSPQDNGHQVAESVSETTEPDIEKMEDM
mgnify:CR=1 FL=1